MDVETMVKRVKTTLEFLLVKAEVKGVPEAHESLLVFKQRFGNTLCRRSLIAHTVRYWRTFVRFRP